MTPRRRLKVPGSVLERAREVVEATTAPPGARKPAPPAGPRGKLLPREKVIAALKRLKSHPMD